MGARVQGQNLARLAHLPEVMRATEEPGLEPEANSRALNFIHSRFRLVTARGLWAAQ